jgi:hypothetical protein
MIANGNGNDALSDYTPKSLPKDFTSLVQRIALTGHKDLNSVTPVLLEEEKRQRAEYGQRLCTSKAGSILDFVQRYLYAVPASLTRILR